MLFVTTRLPCFREADSFRVGSHAPAFVCDFGLVPRQRQASETNSSLIPCWEMVCASRKHGLLKGVLILLFYLPLALMILRS